ncbi:hypothetical protein HAX54_002231 [Datura stramonium]|uniref:Uncharacterized protein n=1 Tax=Datura stramonium TaxID=4076 RepID=A0ABS8T3J0_DATST|nr:hypothetical protein [Datura stramonium]
MGTTTKISLGLENGDLGQWRNRDFPKNDRNGVYVPPRAREPIVNNSQSDKVGDMMSRMMKKKLSLKGDYRA